MNLVEVGKKLRVAIHLLGSLRAVAETIGLSEEMVRQFTRVERLSQPVKGLVASGQLNSVDLADRLSRLPPEDQLPVARCVIASELNPADVRAVLGLRKTSPGTPISKIIDRIGRSRNMREYVAEFLMPTPIPTRSLLTKRLSGLVGRPHVRQLEMAGGIGRIVLDSRGKLALEQVAKKAGLTKREFLQRLVSGKVR